MQRGNLPEGFELKGDHAIFNIALDSNLLDGKLASVNRDPRKARLKPDAYVALVEETGPQCKHIKPGDRVVLERWEWLQFNVDEERIIGKERDVLILSGTNPAPGVIVFKILPVDKKPLLTLPYESYAEKKRGYYFGEVIAINPESINLPEGAEDDMPRIGDGIYIDKYERDQWKLGADKVVFKWDNPHSNKFSFTKVLLRK